LVPKHAKLSESEIKELLDQYKITVKELPKILKSDPILEDMEVRSGDVIKIFRKSPTAGETIYYRGVMNG